MANSYQDGGVHFDQDETMLNNDEYGGVYFDPDDEVLIKDHLLPKLQTYQQPKSKYEEREDLIVMKNVYDKEPWLLDHTKHPLFKKNEWFYYVTRTQVSVKNIGRGKNSKRRITGDNDGNWSWKPNAKKDITDEETNEVIGKMQTLKFTQSNNNKKKKQKTGESTSSIVVPRSKSSWIMYEYSLADDNKFQELVLCKIRKYSKDVDDEDEDEVLNQELDKYLNF